LDLINAGVQVSMLNGSINDLLFNLKIIDFDNLYNVYYTSLFNDEILANITLSKYKANVILTREMNRLQSELNKEGLGRISDYLNTWVGGPIKNTLTYSGNTISETVESFIPNLSFDIKLIIILVLVIVIVK
jgi:hypothetical protein